MQVPVKRWLSPVPTKCDTCGQPIVKVFYDARTKRGPWACMCEKCQKEGPGVNQVGTGIGQEYTEDEASGYWVKTAG